MLDQLLISIQKGGVGIQKIGATENVRVKRKILMPDFGISERWI
jgi:hypothetical protein